MRREQSPLEIAELPVPEVGGPNVSDDFLPERASQHQTEREALQCGATCVHQHRQPIGVRDLHIAGHARSEGLVLVTNNLSEFVRVPALEVENWVHPGQQATETWWFSVIDKV
jgi:hypothetical protein